MADTDTDKLKTPLPDTPSAASAPADARCEHGTAMDVHCCGCHQGFLFDPDVCTCGAEDTPTLGSSMNAGHAQWQQRKLGVKVATEKQTKLIRDAVITVLSDERCDQLRYELKVAYEDSYRASRLNGDDGASMAAWAWAETLRSYLLQAGLVEAVLEALVEPARQVRPSVPEDAQKAFFFEAVKKGIAARSDSALRPRLKLVVETWMANDAQWTDDLIDAVLGVMPPSRDERTDAQRQADGGW